VSRPVAASFVSFFNALATTPVGTWHAVAVKKSRKSAAVVSTPRSYGY